MIAIGTGTGTVNVFVTVSVIAMRSPLGRSPALCLAVAGSMALIASYAVAQVQPSSVYEPPPASQGTVASSNRSASSTFGNASFNAQWATLLGDALYFYDVQRAGALPGNFRVDWRNNSVPNDGSDVGLDLSKGFFDAGNFIKATFPLCWVVTQLSHGAMMYGRGFDGANQTPYLDSTLRVALDWLLIASSKPDEMVVVIGNEDFYWGPDTSIPTDRPSYVISRQNPGTDVFGSCASAFASASMLYNGTTLPVSPTADGTAASLQDADYAATLLQRAETLFNLAQTATPQQVYQKAVKGVAWAYPSTDYADELVLSSTFLALATGNQSYADYAQQTYTKSQFPYPNGALNWDQHTPATPVLLAQLAIARPTMGVSLSEYQQGAEVWLDGITNGDMFQTFSTPGGLFWFEGDSDPASLNPATNAAALMLMYHRFASSRSKGQTYLSWALGQLDYVLGKNPMNAVYPVGIHPNSPQNPQSALAAGGTDPKRIDTQPATEAHVLYGGVVGGPDEHDNYYDQRSNYTQTEVALDSQSPLIVIAAYQLATGADDPYYVNVTQPRVMLPYSPDDGGTGPSGGGGLSQGAQIAIAVVVVVVVLALLLALCFWQRSKVRSCVRRRRFSKY